MERVATDPSIERVEEPALEDIRGDVLTARNAGDVGEPASDVVPLVVQRIVEIEDESLDHHFGWRVNCST